MPDMLDFAGKTVLVVGGSSGIGNAIAQRFKTAGAEVHVWGTREKAEDYSDTEGSHLDGLVYTQTDVADFDAIETYQPSFSSLDALILCQGIVLYNRQEFSTRGFQKVLDVNLTSLMVCANKFHDMLATTKGSMVVVSSSAAFHATIGNPAYNASKTGAYGLTRTLARAYIPEGIRVNGIAPGFVPTKMTSITTENEKRNEAAIARIPQGRMGTVDEIASIALFLASPMAGYIVGQTIVADGGMLL